MDKAKLRKELNSLRTLVKKAHVNITMKLLRDQKLWTTKLAGENANQRYKKKLEKVVAVVDQVRPLKLPELVKDILLYNPHDESPQTAGLSVENHVLARFRAEPKLDACLRTLESAYGSGANFLKLLGDFKIRLERKAIPARATRKTGKKVPKKKRSAPYDEAEGIVNGPVPSKKKKKNDSTDNLENSGRELDVSVNPSKQSLKQAEKKSSKRLKLPEEDDDNVDTELVTDSFFLTETGTNYVAVLPKIPNRDENRTDGQNEDEEEESEPWKLSVKRKAYQNHSRGHGSVEVRNGHAEGLVKNYRQDILESDPTLHPSWAAKQKQKGIPRFAGKKMTFGEEGNIALANGTPAEELHPSWAAKQAQKGIKPFAGKKVVFGEDDTPASEMPPKTTDNLHPSWAAKQAQQGIKPFAGKRMVFTADDESGPTHVRSSSMRKPEAGLHPSWAAKQAQKGIKPFAGKKISFDEESGAFEERTSKNSKFANSNETKRRDGGVFFVSNGKPQPGASDLHPSWAAKQAQKGIKQFAGKKISFEDE